METESDYSSEPFDLILRRERKVLELILDDPGLAKIRTETLNHPAVVRYDRISDFIAGSYSLRYPDETNYAVEIGSAALDGITIGSMSSPEEVLAAIPDQEVLRQLRLRVSDKEQYFDQMAAFNCWSLLRAKGMPAQLVEEEGLPDIRVDLPEQVEWIECKRIRLGSPSSRIRKVIKKANIQIKRADPEGVGIVYIAVERPEHRTVLDDTLPSAIAEYVGEAERELASGSSRSVAAAVVGWTDHMVMGEPPAHTLHVVRRRSESRYHTSPRRPLRVPSQMLVLGRTVAIFINWDQQPQPGPPIESLKAANVVATQMFRQECELPGLVRSVHAIAAMQQPDHLTDYDLGGIKVTLATKWIEAGANSYVLLLTANAKDGGPTELSLAFRAYPAVLGITKDTDPSVVFRKVIERYGLTVSVGNQTGLFVPSARLPVPSNGPAKLVEVNNPLNHPCAVCAFFRIQDGTADVHWAFAIDNYRYRREVKRQRR